jgi:hypothetical protein
MGESIYNLFLIKRPTERWLRLAPAEQSALQAKISEGLAATGGRRVIGCSAHWWNEGYRGWGVEEFPDFASWRHFADLREKLEWYSYLDSWSILGTPHELLKPENAAVPEPGKIYQLFLFWGNTEAHYLLSQAEKDALWAKLLEVGGSAKMIVWARSYWASEEYQAFGIKMFSDIAAVQHDMANQQQIDWPRYVKSRTLLGTLWEG